MARHFNMPVEEYSYIKDKGDIGFIDVEDSRSMLSYNPAEESDIIRISVPFPFEEDKPQSCLVGDRIFYSINITNTTDEYLDVWSIKFYDSKPEDSFTLSVKKPPTATSNEEYIQNFVEFSSYEDEVLKPHETLTIWLSCKPKSIGLHTTAVHFTIGDETIERLAFVLADDSISKSLLPNRPYTKPFRKKIMVLDSLVKNGSYIAASRPAKGSGRRFRNKLREYPIHEDTREKISNKQFPECVVEGPTRENYGAYFRTLLNMEEIKAEEDMRILDMESVCLKRQRNNFLSLQVPGLAEKRPSLVCGDYVFAKFAGNDYDHDPPYQGYVHRVEAEEVLLKFHPDFHYMHRNHYLYNIQFGYDRTSFRRLYQAVEAAQHLSLELLFPSEYSEPRVIQPSPLVPKSLMLNEEQICAIEMILACKGGAPYIIHGPPGTGKTSTLVEAILQIYTTRLRARVLVCAPSNNAADHILERLRNQCSVRIHRTEIFRLNAYTRSVDDVRPEHLDFCFIENEVFKCPPLGTLKHYRIIVSTYASAYLLYAEGIDRGHFSFIFLDEAGQASEPESMVPLCNMCQKETIIVAAGDPLQLGPVIFSEDADAHGLGRSYMQRLFESPLYSNQNKNYITKLVRNYRSHPAILKIPSELFYNGELVSCKDKNITNPASWENLLPDKEFPLLFIGIQGYDEREGTNPSWFNRIEVSQVVTIIKKLIDEIGIHEEDIGVITPYRQQVMKIGQALDIANMPNIKIGSVEQFQGQERKVIIISTVRSTMKHTEFDKTYCLGFLSNPRRFNVAVTRAQSLLIVVANPHIICKDPFWNKILWYCVDNHSYQGCFIPERDTSLEKSLEALKLEDFKPHAARRGVGTSKSRPPALPCNKAKENFNSSYVDEKQSEKRWDEGDSSYRPYDIQWDGGAYDAQQYEETWYEEPYHVQQPDASWDDRGSSSHANDMSRGEEQRDFEQYGAPWGTGPFLPGETPQPVKDEDEWSDGWKL